MEAAAADVAELLGRARDASEVGDAAAALEACEQFEFVASAAAPEAICEMASLHMLANMMVDDLENARFVWQRLDSTFQEKHPEAAAVWGLAVHLWKKDLPGFYKATNHKWSTSVGRAISHVVQAVRAKQFDIIATAYDAIAVSDAAAKLGIDQESAVSRAREAGWGVDGAFLRPVRSAGSGAAGEATAKQLGALTDYVVHLERKVGDVEDDADLKAVVARSSTEAKRGAGLAEMESAGPRM